MDKIKTWLLTHEPKKGSKLDDASTMTKQLIHKEFECLDNMEIGTSDGEEIFKKAVGEDKHGYTKTFGLGVKVLRSRSKRCALEEEKVKRLKVEEEFKATQGELKETKVELKDTKDRLQNVENMLALLLKNQGISGIFSNINDSTTNGNLLSKENQHEDGFDEGDDDESDDDKSNEDESG